MVGLITPHEKGFALTVTEKLEDLVSIILLPLYFAYSGLNTQLGTLNSATSWGLVVLVLVVACGGKIVGCSVSAKLSGMSIRESITVGFLMNTKVLLILSYKGLVELIVLNLGLQGGVINEEIFSIFVVMALVTTFMTVPIVSWIYPYHLYINKEKKIDEEEVASIASVDDKEPLRLLICLTNMRTVPAMMNITQIITSGYRQVDLFALRLIELGNRMSKLMMAADSGETLHADPVMNVFRTFAQLGRQNVTTRLEICDHQKFGRNISNIASEHHCNLIVFPVELGAQTYPQGWSAQVCSMLYIKAKCTVAIFGDRGFGVSSSTSIMDMHNPIPGNNQKIFMPFFGTSDETDALLILSSMTNKDGVSVEIFSMVEFNDALTIFQGQTASNPNVIINKSEDTSLPCLISRIKELSDKDLVVLGYATYSILKEGEESLKGFIDMQCTSSFMLVHRPADQVVGDNVTIVKV